ncbi:MAG: AraC family transcriptional regulator [Cellvibrionaceae bacterium]|nr:AraC family transcriptional regulator [Cellvibrionaceae bacterium]
MMNAIDKKIQLQGNSISYRNLGSYHMPMHDHSALQVLIPLEGSHYEITWALENKDTESKSLGVADICLIPPLLAHEVRWSNCANFISLYITPEYLNDHVEGGFDKEADIIEALIGFDDPLLYQLAQSLTHYFRVSEASNKLYFTAVLTVVAQHIVSNYHRKCANKLLFNDFEQIPCAKIRDAIIYIQNSLDRTLPIEEIADNVKMSHYHFMRTFKEAVGLSPSKFHMQQRIEKAKVLLAQKTPILDVALALGFSSQSHFSNVFTKAVGVTPRKYANH